MDNEMTGVDTDLINLACYIAGELRTASPRRTGNMQSSIATVSIDGSVITIVVAVDYSSYVNDYPTVGGSVGKDGKQKKAPHPNKNYHWIQKVLERCCRCYAENNVDTDSLTTGFSYEVIQSVKGV